MRGLGPGERASAGRGPCTPVGEEEADEEVIEAHIEQVEARLPTHTQSSHMNTPTRIRAPTCGRQRRGRGGRACDDDT